jgi:hypothetical protein
MIISEKQILLLLEIAADYKNKIELMVEKDLVEGDVSQVIYNIQNLLINIRSQQSEELKVIE